MQTTRSSKSQNLYPELLQAFRHRIQRQAHNVEEISLDPLDDHCSKALDPVGPGLIEWFAGFDISLYLVFIQPLEEDLRFYRTGEFLPGFSVHDSVSRDYGMGFAAQSLKHLSSFFFVVWFSEYPVLQYHNCVRRNNERIFIFAGNGHCLSDRMANGEFMRLQ